MLMVIGRLVNKILASRLLVLTEQTAPMVLMVRTVLHLISMIMAIGRLAILILASKQQVLMAQMATLLTILPRKMVLMEPKKNG